MEKVVKEYTVLEEKFKQFNENYSYQGSTVNEQTFIENKNSLESTLKKSKDTYSTFYQNIAKIPKLINHEDFLTLRKELDLNKRKLVENYIKVGTINISNAEKAIASIKRENKDNFKMNYSKLQSLHTKATNDFKKIPVILRNMQSLPIKLDKLKGQLNEKNITSLDIIKYKDQFGDIILNIKYLMPPMTRGKSFVLRMMDIGEVIKHFATLQRTISSKYNLSDGEFKVAYQNYMDPANKDYKRDLEVPILEINKDQYTKKFNERIKQIDKIKQILVKIIKSEGEFNSRVNQLINDKTILFSKFTDTYRDITSAKTTLNGIIPPRGTDAYNKKQIKLREFTEIEAKYGKIKELMDTEIKNDDAFKKLFTKRLVKKPDKPDRLDQPDQSDQPDQPDHPDQPDQPILTKPEKNFLTRIDEYSKEFKKIISEVNSQNDAYIRDRAMRADGQEEIDAMFADRGVGDRPSSEELDQLADYIGARAGGGGYKPPNSKYQKTKKNRKEKRKHKQTNKKQKKNKKNIILTKTSKIYSKSRKNNKKIVKHKSSLHNIR